MKIQPIVFGADSSRISVPVRKMYRGLQDWQKQRKCCTVVSMRIMRDSAPARDDLSRGVRELDQVTVNGLLPDAPYGEGTAAHIVSVSFAGVRSEVLLHALEDKGIYVSAGSACSAHKPQPSATLKAIGIDKSLLDSTIRFSFSVFTTEEEIDVCLTGIVQYSTYVTQIQP